MRKASIMLALALASLLLCQTAFSIEKTVAVNKSVKLEVGKDAPWFSGWTTDDKVFTVRKALDDPKVKRLALVFFAKYCVACRPGIKKLAAAADKMQAQGIQVVLVNFQDKPDEIQQYLKSLSANADGPAQGGAPNSQQNVGIPFTVVLDRYGQSNRVFLEPTGDKVVLPRTVLIGKDGKVQAIFGEEGDDYVDRIMQGN